MSPIALFTIISLFHPIHAIRLNTLPKLLPTSTCPPLPNNSQVWLQGYLWGIMVDGKDAAKGAHAYDWDNNFFDRTFTALQDVYQEEKDKANQTRDLTLDVVEKISQCTYNDVIYEGIDQTRDSSGGIIQQCTNNMSCSAVQQFLQGIPHELWATNERDSSGRTCKFTPVVFAKSRREFLKVLIANYTQAINEEIGRGASGGNLLYTLARFLRNFALLHPFDTANGRVRMVILQREIRRLSIGCGTMMYNNGKHVYVDDLKKYIAKIEEGIAMLEKAPSIGHNPWLEKDQVERHFEQFPTPNGLEQCAGVRSWTSGGDIN